MFCYRLCLLYSIVPNNKYESWIKESKWFPLWNLISQKLIETNPILKPFRHLVYVSTELQLFMDINTIKLFYTLKTYFFSPWIVLEICVWSRKACGNETTQPNHIIWSIWDRLFFIAECFDKWLLIANCPFFVNAYSDYNVCLYSYSCRLTRSLHTTDNMIQTAVIAGRNGYACECYKLFGY